MSQLSPPPDKQKCILIKCVEWFEHNAAELNSFMPNKHCIINLLLRFFEASFLFQQGICQHSGGGDLGGQHSLTKHDERGRKRPKRKKDKFRKLTCHANTGLQSWACTVCSWGWADSSQTSDLLAPNYDDLTKWANKPWMSFRNRKHGTK